MSKNIFIVFFLVVSALNVLALVFSMNLVFTLTKPMIVLLLMAHYARVTPARSGLFLIALFFCLIGDVFLLFAEKHELFFMGGLVAFLAAHVLYIIMYRQQQRSGLEKSFSQRKKFALPCLWFWPARG
jgi:uncharacterized membrane protein YhhN